MIGFTMKFNTLAFILISSFSLSANAANCNTLMGGCPLEQNLATSDHMRSQIQNRVLPQTNMPAASTSVSNGKSKNTVANKKPNQSGIMQTIKQTIVK